jgi:hypothetical protein
MSSSGPSSGGEGYGGGSGPRYTDCKLDIITHIATPNPAVIATLKVGDVLDVVLQAARGPVVLITKTKQQAGGILPDAIAELIQCISEGNNYQAKVIDKKGGNVQVRIKNA